MAATLSVTERHDDFGRDWTYVGVGAFGAAVAARSAAATTATTRPVASVDIVDAARRSFAAGRSVVVATGNSPESVLDEVDAVARTFGRSWLPIQLQAALLRVGPMFLPTGDPCRRCFTDRILQHTTHPETTAALNDATAGEVSGDPGWLPHHAAAAAALLDAAIRGGRTAVGQAVTLQLDTMDVVTARVISCHACPRCGDRRTDLSDELRRAVRVGTAV